MIDYLQPPTYCPDALATDVGWINPKNGELLVAVRNLRQKLSDKAARKQYVREHTPSETEQILEKLTFHTIANPVPEETSTTQKILDHMTANLVPDTFEVSTTQKVLDAITEAQNSVIIEEQGKNLTLAISDGVDVKENFPGSHPETPQPQKRGRGRPKKVKKENE